MKSKIIVVLAMLLLFTLSGCNNTPQTEKTPEPYSSSESNQNASDEDTLPADETNEVETTSEVVQSSETPETQSAAEAGVTESGEPKAPEITAEPTSALQDEPQQKTETQTPVETPQSAAISEETKPKTAYDAPFDIEAIKADCIEIGREMGLALDNSLTPDNAAWWNPVTASQSNQGEALKQNLANYITFHTADNLGAYGMDEITNFYIYCEARGNGEYSIYFLFA